MWRQGNTSCAGAWGSRRSSGSLVRWPYQRLCEYLVVPYASFRRWQHRLEGGQPATFKPGPHKVGPLRPEELHVQLCRLKHGPQRSRGVGRLYRQYQDQISRRDLQALIEAVRHEHARQQQAELRHITWHVPGLVWSLDDAELARFAHHKLYLHQVQDLASRYKFTPWVGERVWGETVAVHLEQLFLRHGPPLVLKRDNTLWCWGCMSNSRLTKSRSAPVQASVGMAEAILTMSEAPPIIMGALVNLRIASTRGSKSAI